MTAPTLAALLDAYRGYAAADPATRAVFALEAASLRRAGRFRDRRRPGDAAPDMPLPAGTGDGARLSDLWRDGPLVLKFYRGRWCPFCTLDLRAWQRMLPELQRRGARMLAVTPQCEREIALTRERDRLRFPIVADRGNAIARAFGIAYEVAPEVRVLYERLGIDPAQVDVSGRWTLPLPAVFLIGRDGRIAWDHVDTDYRCRAEPCDAIARLDALAGR